MHPYLLTSTGLEFACETGVDTIRKHNIAMTDQIIEVLDKYEEQIDVLRLLIKDNL